jgi:hypothetical protein
VLGEKTLARPSNLVDADAVVVEEGGLRREVGEVAERVVESATGTAKEARK